MLIEDDKNYMIEVLTRELAVRNSPRQDLVAPFFNTAFAEELTEGNPRTLAIDAIRLCISDEWKHAPTWLEMVINAFALATLDQRVNGILERSRHRPPAAPNPLDNHILINGSPFVNRKTFRAMIGKLNNSATNTQPVLVVSGNEQTGKSYSHNFIDHFSNHSGSIFVYKCSFDSDLGLETGPEHVAMDLVAKMGRPLDKKPPLETNLKLFSRQLALWVMNEATQTVAQHWFVLDNFRGEKLRTDTKDFIVALTDNVTTGVFQRRCRVILLGFNPASLTIDPAQYIEEFVSPCSVADVQTAILEIIALSKVPIDKDAAFSFVIEGLPVGTIKMQELNTRLRALLNAILSLNDILSDRKDIKFQEVLMNILDALPAGREKLSELSQRLRMVRESVMQMTQP